jgi:PAS domain S-box-containing protein
MATQPNAPIILCVDDDATGLRFRQLILEAKGYKVLVATSAAEGMEVFQSNRVDLVVLDQHLRERVTGTAMATALRHLKPKVPIIILTGSTSSVKANGGADAFICKSEGPDALLNRISALLASSRERTEIRSDRLSLLSPERLATILESVTDAVITIDDEQRIVLFNKGAEVMFRCSGEQALGKRLDAFIPERFRAGHRQHVKNFGHTGVTRRTMCSPGVLFGLRADGTEFPIEATISQVGDDGEKFFTVVLRDVTARVSEEHAKIVLQSVSDALIAIDEKSQILSANPGTERVFGYTSQELVGRELMMLMPDYLRHMHRAAVERYLDTGKKHLSWERVELPGLHKDGHEIPLEVSFGEYVQDGKHVFVGTIRDITERKRAEKAHAQLAAIVDSSNDAIYSKSLDGIVTTWNKAAERLFGYSADEIVGKPSSILFPADKIEEERYILNQIRHVEKVPLHESVRIAKNGRVLHVGVTVSPIRDAQGKVIGASSIARDLTQMKMAEQALRNAEKLAVAGTMAATVAHEINTPLEAVANIHFLIECGELTEAAREFLHRAQEEVKKIGQITKLTLGFHREGEDRRSTEVRTSDLIDDILTLYKHRIESLGVSIKKRYESVGVVIADADELRQVLSNLIVNASEALANKGDKLLIHVYDSPDWRNEGKRGVRIVIADNGSGIPREVRHRLFEPFFTAKGAKGAGLGLWVSRSLVEKHGGRLQVRSTPGGGSAFSIFLPSNAAFPPSKIANPRAAGTVLVVDDEAALQLTTSAILKAKGFQVRTASSAREAIEAIRSTAFDLVVTDMKMETDRAGLGVAEFAAKQTPRPVIIVVSAYPELGTDWKQRGIHAFLEKPMDPSILLRSVEESLARHRRAAVA